MTTEFALQASSFVRFSDDGSHLVGLGDRVTLWNVPAARRVASGRPISHPSSADFSPDGTRLAVKSTSGDVVVLSVPELEVVARLSGAGVGEGTPIRFSGDGAHLVDASWGGVLMVRDPVEGSTAWVEEGPAIFRLACTRDRLTWAYDRGQGRGQAFVRAWPFDAHAPEPVPFFGGPLALAISADGSRVAAVSDGLEVAERSADGEWRARAGVFPAPFDGLDHALCWGPDGELVYAHHVSVRVFDDLAAAPRTLHLPFQVVDVAVSPAAMAAAFGGWDRGRVTAWPLELTDESGGSEASPPDYSDLVADVLEGARRLAKEDGKDLP